MISDTVFIYLLVLSSGVFGVETHGVKTVKVMEGDSVTLNTDVKVQTEDQILWTFGSIPIAEIIKRDQFVFVNNDGIFKEKLHMDNKTGSLTISNIRSEHRGLYQLQISSSKVLQKRFNVTLYAPLPIPDVIRDYSHCSTSSPGCSSVPKCLLLCSVVNVRNVTLSWYKGNSLLSSISVSDLSISLSLPLEINCLDDSYSCVVTYSLTNRTKHLSITELCLSCSELRQHTLVILVITSGFLLLALIVVVVLMVFRRLKCNRGKEKGKLYYHCADTTSRWVSLFLQKNEEEDQIKLRV
ncbi:CD48 antigen [Labeo rohita]|uniref:CD48 antigen n=1 Tax=Labeo rohita TaxID=84645 RepID=A0ABQ8L7C2_LABRO|nr:CD48 antigen [Labeo rohita]